MTEKIPALANQETSRELAIEAWRIRFVDKVEHDARVLMTFAHPAPRKAVAAELLPTDTPTSENTSGDDILDVFLLPPTVLAKKDAAPIPDKWSSWLAPGFAHPAQFSVVAKSRGAEVSWRPGLAMIQCDADQREALLLAVVEFSYYENELRKIENEIARSWGELDEDKGLAYEVTAHDLERNALVALRMDQTLQRRIRHARIEPHLYHTGAQLSAIGQRLGDELREKSQAEDRLEIVDGHLEVFEYIYEMSSQRMGEFRAARQEHTLEWIIIILLAAETIFLIIDLIWQLEV